MHLDIAGVVLNKSEIPYLRTGMSGLCLITVNISVIQRTNSNCIAIDTTGTR